jgi:hypothetical protein
MAITMEHMNILGSIINSSFGKSSIQESGYGVKVSFSGSKSDDKDVHTINPILEIRFETLFNYNPRFGLASQTKELNSQSQKMLAEKLREVKKEFKTVSNESLKLKEVLAPEPSVEHISHNPSLVRAKYSRSIHYELTI